MAKSLPINSTHYVMSYPQNGDRIVTIEFCDVITPCVHARRDCNRLMDGHYTDAFTLYARESVSVII